MKRTKIIKTLVAVIMVAVCVLSFASCESKIDDPLFLAKYYADGEYEVELLFDSEELLDIVEEEFDVRKINCVVIIEPKSGVEDNWYSKYGMFIYCTSNDDVEDVESFYRYKFDHSGSRNMNLIFETKDNLLFIGSQSLWDEVS